MKRIKDFFVKVYRKIVDLHIPGRIFSFFKKFVLKIKDICLKLFNKLISQDIKLYILLSILFSSLLLSFTIFDESLLRLISAVEDLCTSLLYWFWFCYGELLRMLFKIQTPTVNPLFLKFPRSSFEELLNIDFVGLMTRLDRAKTSFWVMFPEYNQWVYNLLFYGLLMFTNLGLCVFLLGFLFYRLMFSSNGRPVGYVSKPAQIYFKLTEKIIKPSKAFVIDLLKYASEHTKITYWIFAVWLANINIITVGIEFFSFYYYFICTLDLAAVLLVIAYVGLDFTVLLLSLPLLYWLVVGARIYYRVCEEQGLDNLKHMEAMNCGYLKTLDVVCLIVGEPGTGKTTLLVDMFLSWINIFKDENLKTIFKYELYFPSFPWASFREDIYTRIENREFYCIPNLEEYVDLLIDFYEITAQNGFIYGYRDDIYKTSVNVGNRQISLREALKEYGKAFMLYTNENLGISNFPIRMDGNFDESKYFKKWNGNFFERKKVSRLTHILNQDMLRHGVKMDPESKEIGVLGPSVIGWTEISKDLGNQLTNSGYKAESNVCNPKNEKSIHSFMFARHVKALIDNFPYIRFITDDQRAANVAASAVGLMCVINISGKSEMKIALPGFDWYLELEGFIATQFNKLSMKRENVRGDVTLSWILIKQIVSCFSLPAQRMRNCFGYEELTLLRQAGNAFSGNEGAQNTAGQASEHVYYKMYWKNYSDRFISDSHAAAYAEAQKRAGIGIDDIPCYQNLRMSPEEIEYQCSRLGNELINMICQNKNTDS